MSEEVRGLKSTLRTRCRELINMRLDILNTDTAYWSAKISGNRTRDIKVHRLLRAAGWQVLTAWECQPRRPTVLVDRIERFLVGG